MPLQSNTVYSLDGRTFQFERLLSEPLPVGSYVELTAKDKRFLGLVLAQKTSVESGTRTEDYQSSPFGGRVQVTTAVKTLRGEGLLLRRLERDQFLPTTDLDTFDGAGIYPVPPERISSYLWTIAGTGSTVEVGSARKLSGQATVRLPVDRFERRTFLCGQSGSGKTFALGKVLEGLLLNSDLRIIILDPNSDFVRLDATRSKADVNKTRSAPLSDEDYEALRDKLESIRPCLHILRPGNRATDPTYKLGIRFGDLDLDTQANLLKLDPLRESTEYRAFLSITDLLYKDGPYSFKAFQDRTQGYSGSVGQHLLDRVHNLRLTDWEIWAAKAQPSLVDRLTGDCRCLVVDLGPLDSNQRLIVALATLRHLWEARYNRKPVLLTIDEAQHLCFPAPSSWLEAETTRYINQIAAEGRKYGLYLLLATQRPRKVHPNALSECDNTILMRLNSRADLEFIAENFSQVPQGLLDLCPYLDKGEALLVGNTPDQIMLTKFEGRLTEEAGQDLA